MYKMFLLAYKIISVFILNYCVTISFHNQLLLLLYLFQLYS